MLKNQSLFLPENNVADALFTLHKAVPKVRLKIIQKDMW